MRNSSLLKWAQNNKNNSKNAGKDEKKWIHEPETLQKSYVVYLVKFLGCTEVDQPKGIDVVKQGIQKLKFSQELKKSETGKTPKVELIINVDGVSIQEPKSKKLMHQYPLHRISYCADDKAEKRFFSFIAKEDQEGGSGGQEVKHTCFVFVSDKLAEEITLTIGQAFELAYKKFLDNNNKELETKKSIMFFKKRISLLERENAILKTRLKDVASIKGQQDVQDYMHRNDIPGDIWEVSHALPRASQSSSSTEASPSNTLNTNTSQDAMKKFSGASTDKESQEKADELICLEATASKLEGFTLDDLNDDDFNPRGASDSENEETDFNPRSALAEVSTAAAAAAPSQPPPMLAPPPALPPREKTVSAPVFGLTSTPQKAAQQPNLDANIFSSPPEDPFATNHPFGESDPFGMSSFNSKPSSTPLFELGAPSISAAAVAAPTFSLDELDPLKK